MEENGASEDEIKQIAKAMQDIGEQGGKLFSRSSDEIAKDDERKRQYVKSLPNLLKEAQKEHPNPKMKTGFGTAKDWLVTMSDRFGLNIAGFKHIVDPVAARHIKNRHGVGNEKEENQIPITDKDFETIPDIVNSPNYLVYGTKTTANIDGIGYLKTMPDGTTYYVEEIRSDDGQLAAKTLYKIGGATSEDLIKESRHSTSKATPPAAKIVDKLRNTTIIPAFRSSLGQGTTEVKQINENGKLFSRNQGAYTPVSRIIELAKVHTPDTFLHEVSHNFFINYFDAIERIADKNSDYVKQAQDLGKKMLYFLFFYVMKRKLVIEYSVTLGDKYLKTGALIPWENSHALTTELQVINIKIRIEV